MVAKHLFDNKGLCGIAMLGDKTDTVILNANRSEREQNFDCGHELMHLSKHRNIGEDCFQCFAIPQPEQNELLEWEANEGSAELLVPYRLILPLVKKAYPSLTNRNAYKQFQVDLSWKFGVSMPVIYYRFESLKYEIAQYNAGVSLKDIEILSKSKLLQKGMHIRSLNDMFNIAS